MIKLVKSYPPIFEFEVEREGVPTIIKAKALFWYSYDEDARQDILKTSIKRFAFERNLDCWLYSFEYQQLDEWPKVEPSELGVSLADVGLAMGVSDEDLVDFVTRFSKSKKITCEKIGKCPNNGRKQLYRLFEIVNNLHDFSPLSQAQKQQITKQLQQVQRKPVANKK